MSEAIRVEPRESAGERCALCHDALGAEFSVCEGCGTETHAACRASLGFCPTIGCRFGRGGVEGVPVGVRVRARVGPPPPSWWLVVGFLVLSVFFYEVALRSELERLRVHGSSFGTAFTFPLAVTRESVLVALAAIAHFLVLPIWIAARARGRAAAVLVLSCQATLVFFAALLAPPELTHDFEVFLAAIAIEPMLAAFLVRSGSEEER